MYKVIKFKSDIALFEDDKVLVSNNIQGIVDFLNLSNEETIQWCQDLHRHENCISDFGLNGHYLFTKELGK